MTLVAHIGAPGAGETSPGQLENDAACDGSLVEAAAGLG